MAMDSRIRPALLARFACLALGLGALACEGPPRAEAALTPFEQLRADSAAGDSAAFATLPQPLLDFLDVREALATIPENEMGCFMLPARHEHELRRRVRLRFDDRASAVLYVVADDSSGSIGRVEYIRRLSGRGQRGLIWDAERDRTTSTWWTETAWGLSRRAERGEIPRGGPVPRALRALGRQLLLLPCAPESDSAAATPP
jgi:hypothetical protein